MQGRLCCLRMQIMLLHCIVSRQKWPEVHIFVHKQKKRGYSACHGLRTPNEAFFHLNPELLGLGRQIGQIHSGAFAVFAVKLSAPIFVQWVPCPCFPLFNPYFYKKTKPLYPTSQLFIWEWDLNLGRKEFEI